MCAELRNCQRWVTNRERQRVPQWRTRDGKTSLSVSRRSCSRYRQIAACCRSEMTSASGSRNGVAHRSKVDWCRLVKTLEDQQTNLVLQALLNGQPVQSIWCITRYACLLPQLTPGNHSAWTGSGWLGLGACHCLVTRLGGLPEYPSKDGQH